MRLSQVNPLPDMPILGSSNLDAIKDMMSKNEQMVIQLSDGVGNIVGKGEIVFKNCLLLMRQNEYPWSKGLKTCQMKLKVGVIKPTNRKTYKEFVQRKLLKAYSSKYWKSPSLRSMLCTLTL